MPDLGFNGLDSPNPTFGPVDDFGNPTGITGAPNALQAAPHAPVYGVPYGYLADPMAKTEVMPAVTDIDPFNPNMVETDPNMQTGLTSAMLEAVMAQNQFNLGIPTSPAVNTNTLALGQPNVNQAAYQGIAMHGALLGALANQAVTQNDIATLAANMSLGPPEGYEQAFAAPMSMADALSATTAAMNPSMTSPDDTSTSDEGSTEGATVGSLGGIGSDAGQSPGQAGVSGSPGGSEGGVGEGGDE